MGWNMIRVCLTDSVLYWEMAKFHFTQKLLNKIMYFDCLWLWQKRACLIRLNSCYHKTKNSQNTFNYFWLRCHSLDFSANRTNENLSRNKNPWISQGSLKCSWFSTECKTFDRKCWQATPQLLCETLPFTFIKRKKFPVFGLNKREGNHLYHSFCIHIKCHLNRPKMCEKWVISWQRKPRETWKDDCTILYLTVNHDIYFQRLSLS